MGLTRENYVSGESDDCSRMIKVGPFVYCGGTTATGKNHEVLFADDSYGQVKCILEKLIKTIEDAGAAREDVYQVKLYVAKEFDREKGLEAFKELFGDVKPIMTCVTIHGIGERGSLVEIELNAIIGSSTGEVWEGIKLERTNYATAAPNEVKFGYSRMVKIGPFVYIGGTTSVQPDGNVAGVGDACEQNKRVYEKLLGIMERAGASVNDIVKIKKYVTEEYFETWSEKYAYTMIPRSRVVLSRVVVDSLTRPEQIVETEIFAIIGSGQETQLPEWGSFDFRKQIRINTEGVWADFIKTGPFLISGSRHSIDSSGVLIGAGDSEKQESHVLKAIVDEMNYFGYTAEDVVKVKGYYTDSFAKLYAHKATSFYDTHLKQVKPLHTGIQVSRVGRKHEIIEIEMLAIKAQD